MNQTRAFLIFAWLMVATLLWMEWNKEQAPQSPASLPVAASTVPGAVPTIPGAGAAIPSAGATQARVPGGAVMGAIPASAPVVSVTTDVLRVELNGGELRQADLLRYPTTARDDSPRVRLLSTEPGTYFTARSGWTGTTGSAAPGLGEFRYVGAPGALTFLPGQNALDVPFQWTGPNGVTIRRVVTFKRGQYVVGVRDTVVNAGTATWSGHVSRELRRVPRPVVGGGPMSPEQYSFQGAAWYSPDEQYEKRTYEDFVEDGPLDRTVTGGWVAMVQHHFRGIL